MHVPMHDNIAEHWSELGYDFTRQVQQSQDDIGFGEGKLCLTVGFRQGKRRVKDKIINSRGLVGSKIDVSRH